MIVQYPTFLDNTVIRAVLKQAWHDSQPGITGGHEEGGFILRDSAGNLSVIRWPKGEQHAIVLPPHPVCKIDEYDIVATFHTHPNIGSDYLQEPSETDVRSVRDDPDLKGKFYESELVISQETIYLITPNGLVSTLGNTQEIFTEG